MEIPEARDLAEIEVIEAEAEAEREKGERDCLPFSRWGRMV
jgi:hypothetical protein